MSGGGRETDPHWVGHQPPGVGGTHRCAQTDPEHFSAGEGGREGGREGGGRGREGGENLRGAVREREREGAVGKEGGEFEMNLSVHEQSKLGGSLAAEKAGGKKEKREGEREKRGREEGKREREKK